MALLGGSRRCSDTTGIGGKADTRRDRFTPTPAQGDDPAANAQARGLTIPDKLIVLADKSDQRVTKGMESVS